MKNNMRTFWQRLRIWQLHRRADYLLKVQARNERIARRQRERAHRRWLLASTLRGQAERLRRDAA